MNDEMKPKRNWLLFYEIANVMEFQPERYAQESWGKFMPAIGAAERFRDEYGYDPPEDDFNWTKVEECGTAMCIAGHAAMMTGWFPTRNDMNGAWPTASWASVCDQPGRDYAYGKDVQDVARDALGLYEDEAAILFCGSAVWTPDEIRGFGRGDRILHEGDSRPSSHEEGETNEV
jgi:hypothetical protein